MYCEKDVVEWVYFSHSCSWVKSLDRAAVPTCRASYSRVHACCGDMRWRGRSGRKDPGKKVGCGVPSARSYGSITWCCGSRRRFRGMDRPFRSMCAGCSGMCAWFRSMYARFRGMLAWSCGLGGGCHGMHGRARGRCARCCGRCGWFCGMCANIRGMCRRTCGHFLDIRTMHTCGTRAGAWFPRFAEVRATLFPATAVETPRRH